MIVGGSADACGLIRANDLLVEVGLKSFSSIINYEVAFKRTAVSSTNMSSSD